jgi:hypothetical protein
LSTIGFAIQAVEETGKMVIGKFSPDPKSKFLGCAGKPMSLAYEGDSKPKTSVNFKWNYPADLAKGKSITFKAAVAKTMKERFMLTKSVTV